MRKRNGKNDFFDGISKGLNEAIRFARGEISLRVWEFEDPPPDMKPEAIVALRRRRKMSQDDLARFLHVSLKSVQAWELGRRKPSRTSLMTLQIMAAKPKMMRGPISGANGRKKKPA